METETMRRKSRNLLRVVSFTGLLVGALASPITAQGLGLAQLMKITDWGTGRLILFDELEYAPDGEGRPVLVDAEGWYGGAISRLWVQAEAEQTTLEGGGGDAELRVSYGRLVTPYFDALIGGRVDGRWGSAGSARSYLALGLKGVAPLRFELAPTLYLSQGGDVSGRFEAEYQVLVTQKLVAATGLELNGALQAVPEWGVGEGLNDIDVGLRLRYEFRREFAPYVGYTWNRRFGERADFARLDGEAISEGLFVAGLRVWR